MDAYISYKFDGPLSSTSAVNAAQLCALEGSTFVFRYYSLGGDTAMPGGLYAGFCHLFLILFYMCFTQTYHHCGSVFPITACYPIWRTPNTYLNANSLTLRFFRISHLISHLV